MRGFLWCHGSLSRGKAKVAWDVVCLPKVKGGLGIHRLDTFNKALMVSHIWKLLSLKELMWVQWIHAYKLRGRNFWDIPCRGNMTWGWRKILQLRPLIRDFIWHKLGDGSTTSAWYDRWCLHSPLANVISHRDLFREGFDQVTKVRDLMINGHLSWPHSWLGKYLMLSSIPDPVTVPSTPDVLEWRDSYGTAKKFSVKTVWGSIGPRSNKVVWYHAVWFPECIPRHAFHLWLVIKRRLKTQDSLRAWDHVDNSLMTCPLCDLQPDSHEHLFFDCVFSKQVWYEMKGFAGLPNSSSSIDAILNDIYPFAMKKMSRSVIAKLVPCGMSYGFDSSSLLLEVNAMDMDSVDKNYPKDVQLQDEDIMYDIASSVE
ncbi:putative reverse transcriptase domain-containing protein, partial [Tanacetum coccineum]